jgi:hypothetical protein
MTKGFLRFLRRNTIALLALFLALGGTTYAASTALIGKNTVASPQVVNGSLKTNDLSKKARAALRGQRGARGAQGAPGAPGAPGAKGATGAQGLAGRSALTALQSGETESGDWGVGKQSAAAAEGFRAVANFPIPLAAGLDGVHTIYVSGASATHCPGQGQAESGYLCVYQGFISAANTPNSGNIFNPEIAGGPGGTGKYGFSIFLSSSAAGTSTVSGVYSVTG